MDSFNMNENENLTDEPVNAEIDNSESEQIGAAENAYGVADPYIGAQAEDPQVYTPRADFTQPWREPTYSATTDSTKTYSPGHYEGRVYTPKKPKKKSNGLKVAALILVCAIICGLCGGGAAYLVTSKMLKNANTGSTGNQNQVVLGAQADSRPSNEKNNAESVTASGDTLSAKEIYALACEQVVGINTSVTTTNIFGQASSSAVSGSGFIINPDGYILTNYHVIEYAAVYGYDMSVILHDGTSYPAEIIGYEADNDVAVVKIDAKDLVPVSFGESNSMNVGETVYTIGNPLGELEFTMTSGIVSALDRYVTTDEKTSINMFQIDAAVNSGNSGGPVYNSKGKVVGIVTAKYSSTGVEGLGFAIPIDDAVNISDQLINQGYVSGKAYLGVNVQDITETYAYYLNLPQGAYIYSLNEGSCAVAAGLKVGDVITAVGDYPVASTSDLKSALHNFSSGDTTTLTVYRSGETIKITVTFDEKAPTEESDQNNQNTQGAQDGQNGQGGQGYQGYPGYQEGQGDQNGGSYFGNGGNDFWSYWGFPIQ